MSYYGESGTLRPPDTGRNRYADCRSLPTGRRRSSRDDTDAAALGRRGAAATPPAPPDRGQQQERAQLRGDERRVRRDLGMAPQQPRAEEHAYSQQLQRSRATAGRYALPPLQRAHQDRHACCRNARRHQHVAHGRPPPSQPAEHAGYIPGRASAQERARTGCRRSSDRRWRSVQHPLQARPPARCSTGRGPISCIRRTPRSDCRVRRAVGSAPQRP